MDIDERIEQLVRMRSKIRLHSGTSDLSESVTGEDDECLYCYALVTQFLAPAVDDDEMWACMAPEHDEECEWIATRAHRL